MANDLFQAMSKPTPAPPVFRVRAGSYRALASGLIADGVHVASCDDPRSTCRQPWRGEVCFW